MWETLEDRRMMSVSTTTITQPPPPPTTTSTIDENDAMQASQLLNLLQNTFNQVIKSLGEGISEAARKA